jgi:hypothetical protein
MRRFRRRSVALLAVGGTIVLAACGGDGGPSTGEFLADADAACIDQNREAIGIQFAEGSSQSVEEEAALGRELIPVRADLNEQLEALEPPEELLSDWDRYLALRNELLDVRRRQLAALERGDPVPEQLATQATDLEDRSLAIAERIGLTACASVLPRNDRDAALSVVKEVAVTPNPQRVCGELASPNYLEESFHGSFRECARYQRKASGTFPDDVKLVNAEGVEGVVAYITIEDVGGGLDGRQSKWTLIRHGGRWQVFFIVIA